MAQRRAFPPGLAARDTVPRRGGLNGIAEVIAPDALYIDMSIIAPAMTDSLDGRLAERAVAMVDAPVGRQQQHAIEGKLLIMVGGKASDLERARPVLERMGDTIVHCGPVGAGSRMKIVNNFMSTTLNFTTAEALTLAKQAGLTSRSPARSCSARPPA